MLETLSIKNYVIIQHLEVQFSNNFCVITGETGAGKSIIMGALSLILGQRADTSVLNNREKKCIIEGRFSVDNSTDINSFFDANDLDFELPITLRREINVSGKSRAFINDTPVTLNIIRELGIKLIDIHSQHSNLELGKRRFQLNVVDWYAGHFLLINEYSVQYKQLRKIEKEYNETVELATQAKADFDYYEFQFKQLDDLKLEGGELSELEAEQEILTHSEDIKTGLSTAFQLIDGDELSILPRLKETISSLNKISGYQSEIQSLQERLDSQYLELQDIASECELLAEKTEYDPSRLELITERLNSLYTLFQKHRVQTVEELILLRDEFDAKLQSAASYDLQLEKFEKELQDIRTELSDKAKKLTDSRKKQFPEIEKEIVGYLKELGMPNARFSIELKSLPDFQATGKDEVNFMFAANKGGTLEEITKVASGGEMSRLMLSIKTVVAKSKALPAIIFDEIDTGISGEIALKMGAILKSMAEYMQVINITHLPQIASKGNNHYIVYKKETPTGVETGMRQLNDDERVLEIAKMLSGEKPTSAAIENAKSLLN